MAAPVAKLALEDGTIYTGRAFGAAGETLGEVVFNTSMTGYQEVLTDPSYTGQIVTMTYPLIGNYGTTPEDRESTGIRVAGFIVRELTRMPSNFRSQLDLDGYLAAKRDHGHRGHRHAGAGPPLARPRRDERHPLHGRSGRCRRSSPRPGRSRGWSAATW